VEQPVVAQVHEEQDHEGGLQHRDRHRDREVDVGPEVDLGGEHGDQGQHQQRAAGRDQHLDRGDVRQAMVTGIMVVVVVELGGRGVGHGRL